jgi:hypothetical protein
VGLDGLDEPGALGRPRTAVSVALLAQRVDSLLQTWVGKSLQHGLKRRCRRVLPSKGLVGIRLKADPTTLCGCPDPSMW